MLTARWPPAWLRHPARDPAFAVAGSGLVLTVVALALFGHAVTLASQQAINLDGSRSALTPASPERVALDLTAYYASGALLIATYVGLLVLSLRGRVHGLGRTLVLFAPVALQLLLLVPRPYLSTDVLSYLAQGALGSLAGIGNAWVLLVEVVRDERYRATTGPASS